MTETPARPLPTAADVVAASERLSGVVTHTPCFHSEALNALTGKALWLKAENLQRTGSFKFRGAYNRLVQLSPQERARGVIAWSSGNHAQGVAAAAKLLGMAATVVMPEDAPALKRDNTLALGAEVILYDRWHENREDIARARAAETGAIIVPSYDDPHIVAGQGSVAYELFQQCAEQGVQLDTLLVCCSGGGLMAGCALAAEAVSPTTQLYSVEPDGFDDHARSLASGRREHNAAGATSICDALLAPTPGELTFAINQSRLTGGLVVTDDEVRTAIRVASQELKLVLEPGGAVALAAALAGKLPANCRQVGVVLSGGNIDPTLFAQILQGADD